MRALVSLVAGVVAGLVIAEGLVRLVTSSQLDYVSFMRPGPYCVDPVLGMTSACAGRSMMMRVPDEPRYVPVSLDALGNRGPFLNGGEAGRRKKILIVGGASQGFGFALPDHETYTAVAARHACRPVEIHSAALVGTNNEMTWDTVERVMLDRLKPDGLILAVYFRDGHPDLAARIAPQVSHRAGFAVLDGFEFYFPARIGPPFRHWTTLVRAYDLWARAELRLESATGWPPRLIPRPAQGPELKGNETLAASIRVMAERAAARQLPFSVLLLPWGVETNDAELKAMLPDLRIIDAKAAVTAAGMAKPFFPDGHFRPPTADLVGRLVASDLCSTSAP